MSLASRGWLSDVERRLGRRAVALRAEGRRLSMSDAIELARGDVRFRNLTPREMSVAELVAQGHTDKEIAAKLSISERTAESHVLRVREKLGIRSRAEIGRWAAEHLSA
jgi:non-specific serine/threonine protein kinase